MERMARIKPGRHAPCPVCGNDTEFRIQAIQVQEDLCEIAAQCRCGHDPGADGVEDVWGEINHGTAQEALEEWDRAVLDNQGGMDE